MGSGFGLELGIPSPEPKPHPNQARFHALHDANSRTYFQFVASARWLGLRLDLVRVKVSSP